MDFIEIKIREMQNKYLDLLHYVKDKVASELSTVIELLNTFWETNKKVISFSLENYYPKYETVVFTGATHIDYDGLEHFPLLTCGKVQILDDPLCRYIDTYKKSPDPIAKEMMNEVISTSINDNIKILSFCNQIIILPIKWLFGEINSQEIYETSSEIFLNFFNNKYANIDEYFDKVKNINDLKENLLEEIESRVLFPHENEISNNLEERISSYYEYMKDKMHLTNNPGKLFYIAMITTINQVLEIISLSLYYEFTPYIRYKAAFIMFTNVIRVFHTNETAEKIKILTYCCYIIYKNFDYVAIQNMNVNDYSKIAIQQNILMKLYEILKSDNMAGGMEKYLKFIDEQMNELISVINTHN